MSKLNNWTALEDAIKRAERRVERAEERLELAYIVLRQAERALQDAFSEDAKAKGDA